MAILVIDNLTFCYDQRKKVLNGISLSVNEGEYIAVCGHNGSGKSTLAKVINGLLAPTSGEVTVDGFSSLNKQNVYEIRKRVGVVFQNPDNQQVASIVEDDVAFGPENLGLKREEIGERIDFALQAVGMQEYRKKSPARLSGGQKQRLAIAGVLALKPKIIILDESTAMLDPKGRKEVLSVVQKLNAEGVTVIAITHYMEEVVNADRVVILNEGKITAIGKPKQVFANKSVIKEAGLELPPATAIAEKLNACGVNVSLDVLTKEELKDELCKLFQKV